MIVIVAYFFGPPCIYTNLSTLLQVVAKISRIFRRANYFEPFGGRRQGNGRNGLAFWWPQAIGSISVRNSTKRDWRRRRVPPLRVAEPSSARMSLDPQGKRDSTHNQRDPYKRSSHTHNRFVVFRFLCSQLSCSAAVHNWQHSPKLCVRLNWEKLWIWFKIAGTTFPK